MSADVYRLPASTKLVRAFGRGQIVAIRAMPDGTHQVGIGAEGIEMIAAINVKDVSDLRVGMCVRFVREEDL